MTEELLSKANENRRLRNELSKELSIIDSNVNSIEIRSGDNRLYLCLSSEIEFYCGVLKRGLENKIKALDAEFKTL